MVSPSLALRIRGQIHEASEKATSVGDFHRRVTEIVKSRKVRIVITQKYKKGTIKNQFIFQPGGKTSVLQRQDGRLVMVHLMQTRLNEMRQKPEGTSPADKRSGIAYDLLSSAMQIAVENTVDDVSIEFL